MAARHGTISPTLRAGVPFFGGAEGGRGGLAVMECTHPCGGGVAGGSSVRPGRVNPVASLGLVAPSRKNLGFAGGDSAIYIYIYIYIYRYIYIYIYIYPLIYTPLPYSTWLHSQVRAKGTTWCIHVAERTKLDQNGLKMGSKHLFVYAQWSKITFGIICF